MNTPLPMSRRHAPARKLAFVAAAVAFTMAVSGYFMGLLQTTRSAGQWLESRVVADTPPDDDATDSASHVPLAPSYDALTERAHLPNHDWRNELAALPPAPVFTDTTHPLSREELVELLARRDTRRAYDGAPPTVPHPIDQHQSASCLACHGQPTRVGAIDVPQMSHALHSQCIQCHAPAHGPGVALATPPPALATPALNNGFSGLPAPSGGTRAHADAPPTMPHSTAMRQNCVTCHGPGGSSAIKTTHPSRQNCLQCHATDAVRETLPPTRL